MTTFTSWSISRLSYLLCSGNNECSFPPVAKGTNALVSMFLERGPERKPILARRKASTGITAQTLQRPSGTVGMLVADHHRPQQTTSDHSF